MAFQPSRHIRAIRPDGVPLSIRVTDGTADELACNAAPFKGFGNASMVHHPHSTVQVIIGQLGKQAALEPRDIAPAALSKALSLNLQGFSLIHAANTLPLGSAK
jgi:hypothetical protein